MTFFPVIVIEPEPLFREGLRRILVDARFRVSWCEEVPPEGPIDGLSPDQSPLIIIGTGAENLVARARRAKEVYPNASVLLIGPLDREQIVTALNEGVDTVISRTCSYAAFISTLGLVLEGAAVLPRELVQMLTKTEKPAPAGDGQILQTREEEAPDPPGISTKAITSSGCSPAEPQSVYGFSGRELNVLEQLREGRPNKEIARILGISEATVKVHVKAILRKTQMRNRTEAAMWALKLSMGQGHEVAAIHPSFAAVSPTEH